MTSDQLRRLRLLESRGGQITASGPKLLELGRLGWLTAECLVAWVQCRDDPAQQAFAFQLQRAASLALTVLQGERKVSEAERVELRALFSPTRPSAGVYAWSEYKHRDGLLLFEQLQREKHL